MPYLQDPFESGMNPICCWKWWSHAVLWAQSFTPTALPSAVICTYVGLWWAGSKRAPHGELNSLTHSFAHGKLHTDISKCYLRSAQSDSVRSLLPINISGCQRRKLKWQEGTSCSPAVMACYACFYIISKCQKWGKTDPIQNTCNFTTPLCTGQESCTCLVHTV